jgi:uncharacterized membrane protein
LRREPDPAGPDETTPTPTPVLARLGHGDTTLMESHDPPGPSARESAGPIPGDADAAPGATRILPQIARTALPGQMSPLPVRPIAPFPPDPRYTGAPAAAPLPRARPVRAATPQRLPATEHWLTPLTAGLGLLAAEGASTGLAGWAFRNDPERLLKYASSNEIPLVGRTFALGNMAAGAGAAILLGLLIAIFRRRRGGAALTLQLGRRMAPLVLTGLLPFLFDSRLWAGRELNMLLLIALFGLGLQRMARLTLATAPVWRNVVPGVLVPLFDGGRLLRNRAVAAISRAGWVPWLVVLAGVAGYAIHFSYHTLHTHYRLGTASLDLGLEDNLVWNAAHGGRLFKTSPLGGPDAVHTGFHQTWFSYLIAPLYRLAPRPQTLLVFQATMIALAAIPLFLLARRRLGNGIGVVLALGYLMYPPVHGSNLYDFHYQPLSPFFLLTALYFLVSRRNVLAALTIVVAFSLREDIPALVAVLGVFLIVSGERPRAGLVVTIAGGLVFGALKFVIMPRFLGGAEAYVHQYKNLLGPGQQGFGGVLKTVLGNPFFTLGTLIERDKLIYVLQLFAPLAFLPFRRSIGLLLCVPGFFFTLLATEYPPLIQISFQYTAYWTPFLFIACIAALEGFEAELAPGRPAAAQAVWGAQASRRAWVIAFAGAMLAGSFQFGAILNKRNTHGGFGPYRFGLTAEDHTRHAQVQELIALVPPRAKIVASEFLVPQVSGRPDAYTLRMSIYDAEYLLFESPPGGEERQHVIEALHDGAFGVVEVKGPFVLAKRGHPTTRNAEVLAGFGG